ncbi:hypothetical protein GCM10027062_45450 [Nocardioides hungaricus]
MICHNDFAPYNLVFRDRVAVGAIDWDYASPGPRLWDLCYLAYRLAPLSTAVWGDDFDHDQRRRRLRRLLAAYGTTCSVTRLLAVLRKRLLELANFSDAAALRLANPVLSKDAALYRTDADSLL